jgi:hypothetical protein
VAVAFLGAGSVGDLVLQTISIGHLVAPRGMARMPTMRRLLPF